MARTRSDHLITAKINKIIRFYENNKDLFALPITDPKAFEQTIANDVKKTNVEFNSLIYQIAVHQYTNDTPSGPAIMYSKDTKTIRDISDIYEQILQEYIVAIVGKNYAEEKKLGGLANGDTQPLRAFLTKYPTLVDFLYQNTKNIGELAHAARKLNKIQKQHNKPSAVTKLNTSEETAHSHNDAMEIIRFTAHKRPLENENRSEDIKNVTRNPIQLSMFSGVKSGTYEKKDEVIAEGIETVIAPEHKQKRHKTSEGTVESATKPKSANT